jgi:hypothetical protein
VLRKSVTLAALISPQAVDQLVEDYHDTPAILKIDACSN